MLSVQPGESVFARMAVTQTENTRNGADAQEGSADLIGRNHRVHVLSCRTHTHGFGPDL